jgi:hypothetical protein
MKPSSFININGDIKQSKLSIFIYLIFNLIQNICYSLITRNFKYIKLNPKKKKYNFNNVQSISRKLCGIFWQNINWRFIFEHIGKFNICEIGTGDGNYYKTDISIKEKYIHNYTGFDVKKYQNWKKIQNNKFSYIKFNGYNFKKIITKKHNLFLSQSCLEHVKYDLKFFYEIKKNAEKTKKKIVMMHCLPNSFCLFTYLTHGYRQYNIQNLNKISNIIGSDNLFVVKLGNLRLNLEHLKKTTFPLIIKKKNLMRFQNKSYYNKINKIILKNKNSSLFMSSFIVQIGFINFSKKEKKELTKKIFS